MTKMPRKMSAPSVAGGAGNPAANGGRVSALETSGKMKGQTSGKPIQGDPLPIPGTKMPRRSGGAPTVIPR